MSVTVRIPTILRQYTGGAAEVVLEEGGLTVAGVLEALDGAYPGIRERVVDEHGQLRRFVNLYVGDEDVPRDGGLATVPPSGALISIIPAVAGG